MSADHTSGQPPRAPRLGLAFGALAVALVIWVVWFITRPAEPDVPSQSPAASPPERAQPRLVTLEQKRAAVAKEAEAEAAPAAPAAAPNEPPAASTESATADVGLDIRGRTVRASNESPFEGATVIALQRTGTRETELARATSGADGGFTLHTPRSLDAFQVLVRDPSWAPDDPRPGQQVQVGVEWGSPGAETSELRLVLQTGWLLDVRVENAYGGARGGVVVSGAGRSATTDAIGRCRLLDLPFPEGVTLTATAPGAPPVTQIVSAPMKGLRQDVSITVP